VHGKHANVQTSPFFRITPQLSYSVRVDVVKSNNLQVWQPVSQPHSLATENHHSSASRGASPTYWSAKDWHTDTVFEPSSTKFPCSHERNLRDYGMRRARGHHRATYLVKIAPKAEQQLQVRVLTLARRRPHGIVLCALYQRRVRRATRRTVRRWRGTLPVLMTVSWPATQHASWLYL